MFFKNKNLRSQSERLLTKRKAGKVQLVFLFLLTILSIANCDIYAQSGDADSAVIEYKSDTSRFFTVTKSGKVGIGIGQPQVQFHTTGPVRFAGYKNSSLLDSVLSTDPNGNLILVPKVSATTSACNWDCDFIGTHAVNFRDNNSPYKGEVIWGSGFAFRTMDTSSNGAKSQTLSLNPTGGFILTADDGFANARINGQSFPNGGQLTLAASDGSMEVVNQEIKTIDRGFVIRHNGIQILRMKNNVAEDSVLTLDANGNIKLKYISTPPSPAQADSSWAWIDSNIYNKNRGYVGIGTQTPTAKLHANGTVRFESYKNNLQGDSVLTTDINGNLKFVYMPYGSSGGGGASYSFQNGVIQSNGYVSLGGQLQDSVKINLSGYQFSYNNGADKVLHMSADGNVGMGAVADANYKLNVHGDMILGHHFDNPGGNEKLSFGGTSNTDPLFLQRYNAAANATDLRVNIGDDGGSADRFVVGFTPHATTSWINAMVVEAGGKVGVGTDQVTGELAVGRDHGVKLAVGNGQWLQQAIIRTANDNNNGDYTDLLVPGATGNTSLIRLNQAGNVGIGTLVPDALYRLSVNGKIRAKGLRVQSAGWSDFVFEPGYKLMSLPELEKYVKINRRLPEIPSEQEVMTEGQEVGEIQSKLLQKIEELTLYTIELNKQVKRLEDKNKKLEAQQLQIDRLQQQLEELKKLIGK